MNKKYFLLSIILFSLFFSILYYHTPYYSEYFNKGHSKDKSLQETNGSKIQNSLQTYIANGKIQLVKNSQGLFYVYVYCNSFENYSICKDKISKIGTINQETRDFLRYTAEVDENAIDMLSNISEVYLISLPKRDILILENMTGDNPVESHGSIPMIIENDK